MNTRKNRTSFDRLSDAQKEAIYQECEQIGPEDGEPLTKQDREKHRKAGLPVGRPRIGRGVKRINVSMEKGLLRIADSFARKNGISRAGLIARSIQAYISRTEVRKSA